MDTEASTVDRCGYVWRQDATGVPNNKSCCFRETAGGSDRCAWHAGRSGAETRVADRLRAARTPAAVREQTSPYGEIIDGAVASEPGLPGGAYERTALRGADLTDAPLRGVNLAQADLSEAVLAGAYLKDATLTGATLTGADLSGAYLIGADLSGVELTGADLSGAVLTDVDLSAADLTAADLTGATVQANVEGAVVRGAVVTDTELIETTLPEGAIRTPASEQTDETPVKTGDSGDRHGSGTDERVDWRRRLAAGTVAGGVSVLVGYLVTLAVVSGFERGSLIRARLFDASGWAYYGAQLVQLEVSDPLDSDTRGAFDGDTWNIVTQSGEAGILGVFGLTVPSIVYHLVPVVVLLVAGAVAARSAGVETAWGGATTGLATVPGGIVVAALGALAFSTQIDGLGLGVSVLESVRWVGVAFPAVVGTAGGVLWGLIAGRSGIETTVGR